ncbi:MAG: 7-cyano-7-deazaguanine synthase QueC [Bdellovibrio sp.]|jgi:7-cyano-7-deazaguanine synthase
MKKSVVLLSAGLDSTVNFYQALQESNVVLAVTFDYGQRAAGREIQAALKICQASGVSHQSIELPFFKIWGGSSLVDLSKEIPLGSDVSIDDFKISQQTAKSVWVPNRNGVFLNIAAGFAEAAGAAWVIPGFNKEEAATFPDNSEEFLQQTSKSFSYSTANRVQVKCFTTAMSKSEIVKRGLELGVDFGLMWPCYQAASKWCGQCESCLRSRRALESQGLKWSDLT